MTLLPLLRMVGALALVLGGLAGALWAVRRFDLRLPGRIGAAPRRDRRLELVERLTVDPRRSVLLIRRDGREHLLLIAPEGHVVIEAVDPSPAAPAPAPAPTFDDLVARHAPPAPPVDRAPPKSRTPRAPRAPTRAPTRARTRAKPETTDA
ncbi:FliO/MopB family protein [Sphingomonas sp. PAMC 26617]|uniref:FliO/MopB family protein n=1 Tax=Sphingomonas sp. PAMC 26617 TaxID=1112216 RepID=UPI000287B72D|nr:flagellar biosynthetic protein FliO [Sphingomonas sp. PAMC 26617]